MKKIIILILFATMWLVGTVYAINIDKEEMSIGGIQIGSSLDYVEQIYGQPVNKQTSIDNNGIIDNYNNLLVITASKGSETTFVNSIICREGNLSTPSGFAVGTPFTNVIAKYPKGSILTEERAKRMVYSYQSNYTYYSYHCMYHWSGYNAIDCYMIFAVDQKGIIQEIQCKGSVVCVD
ncbi:MAG: hypothetical protein LKI17_01200 [Megasphaera cerevisiae]|jgi:hypothetical protein|nr:hypothetical protein [Megasphaera cerevisiae]